MDDLKAVWSTAYVNDLPDSAFLYVESGEKDGEGRTTPRSKRHFPYKDADGKVDLPHLENAIGRIPQSDAPGLTAERKESLQERARGMLEKAQGEKGKAGDLSLTDLERRIRGAFGDQFGSSVVSMPAEIEQPWVEEIFDDYVIVNTSQGFYRVPYTETPEGFQFAALDQWSHVAQSWVETGKRARARRMLEKAQGKNVLKAVSRTDDELRVANYIVLFGGRDLEGVGSRRQNEDGSLGEFFTKATDLASAYTQTGRFYVDWEHGMREPGADAVLGYVDWGTKAIDERGVWVERVLNRRNQYVQWLDELVEAGLIGTSSEPVDEAVKVKADGEIARWPLRRDTLTVTPMEPRMMSENTLRAYKALGFEIEPEPEARPEAEDGRDGRVRSLAPTAAGAGKAVDTGIESITEDETMSKETTTVELSEETQTVELSAEEIQGMVTEAAKAAAVEAIKAFLAEQKPEKSGLIVTQDEADKKVEAEAPYKSMGEFLIAVARGDDPELRALKSSEPWAEGGYSIVKAVGQKIVGSLSRAKAISGMSELVPADGGILVGTDRTDSILARAYDVGQLLQRVDMVGISANSNGMVFFAEDESSRETGSRRGGIRFYWAAEADEKTSSKPKFRKLELKLNKAIGLVYATDELLQDAAALGSWIMQNLPEELRFGVEDGIIRGTGAGQPMGILNSGCLVSVGAEPAQAATTLVAENVINMWARRWIGGRDYVWLINQDVEPQLIQMNLGVGAGGALVYMPPGGLSGAPYASLMGKPVLPLEYMPTLGTVGDIMLASLSEYQMIDKGGMQAASSIHVRFIYDEQVFRFVYRVDGEPKWDAALTPYQGTDTVSPFVVVATRS